MTESTIVDRGEALTAREVGVLLRLHRDTVKAIPRSELPFYRRTDRGHRRYFRGDVEAYIARRVEA